MRYEYPSDIQAIAEEMCNFLFPHVQIHNIMCFRSYGTSTKTTIARCHALGKIMQKALGRPAFYTLEFLSEQFDKLDKDEQVKTILHEIMHIPKAFGGGFKHHDFVTNKNVDKYYKEYKKKKNEKQENQIKL